MLICLPDILSADEVKRCRAIIENAQWEDGRATAGTQSATVKHNRQLPRDSEAGRDAGRVILQALTSNAQFLSAALPHQMMPPLFNRYGVGEDFGVHVDNAIRGIGGGTSIRTDLSITVFLSDASEYDGGELTIETLYGSQEVKLPAGHAVLYPSTSLHRVAPVTKGERIASFFWIQSMLRDESARTMLYDLDQTIQSLAMERGIDDVHVVRLTGFYHNLIRRWAEL